MLQHSTNELVFLFTRTVQISPPLNLTGNRALFYSLNIRVTGDLAGAIMGSSFDIKVTVPAASEYWPCLTLCQLISSKIRPELISLIFE